MLSYADVGRAKFLQITEYEALEIQGGQIHGGFHSLPMVEGNTKFYLSLILSKERA